MTLAQTAIALAGTRFVDMNDRADLATFLRHRDRTERAWALDLPSERSAAVDVW